MQAIAHDGPAPLRLVETHRPRVGAGQVLIQVAAAGVNRPDLVQRAGLYPPPAGASPVLGLEVSGTVVETGEGVTRWRPGDQVCALLAGGGYAGYAVAEEGSCLPVPAGLSLVEAAALPETVLTVWANVFDTAALAPHETLLVHGGASGIGTTAIQMARAHGARVAVTAGSPEKLDLCRRLGADIVIDHRSQDFAAVLEADGGADVILDMVGGDYVARNIAVLKPGGRMVSIAFLRGSRVEIDLMRVMLRRLTLTGSTLRARPVAEKARLAGSVHATVWPWIEAGRLRPVIDAAFPLADAEAAHRRMQAGANAGKIVLVVDAAMAAQGGMA
jgi:putative PIG3 family NAD(P)H quinone oxidoreductase